MVYSVKTLFSSLQLRGNALFSDKDLPLDSVTVEYAWLLELTLGKLFGRFTTSHLIQTAKFLEIFASFALSEEEAYACPKSIQLCQHMVPVELCPKSALTTSCPSESQLKYKMLRLSLDQMDIYLVESDCSLRLQVEPVRLAQCSLHTDNTDGGLTVRLGGCSLTQFLATGDSMLTGKTSKRPWTKERLEEPPLWLECGHMQIEEMTINLTTPCVDSFFGDLQRQFLLAHDRKMTRLWFLWEKSFKCGCIGGCQFFLSERPHSSRDWFDTTRSFAVSANSVVDDCEDLCFGESILRSREPIILSKFDPVFGQQTYVKSNLCEMVDTIDSTVGEEIFYETHEEIPLE